MHAGQRQAQRPRQRRTVAAPSHVLRDAREFLLRRLFQERRHPLRLGASDRRLADAAGQAGAVDFQRRARHSARRGGLRALETIRPRRSDSRARSRRQLLADGRHRPLRTLLGDLLRSRDRPGSRDRDLEQRVHGVRAQRRRHAHAAARTVDRHRHGPGAHHGRPPAEGFQLRHRRLHANPRRQSSSSQGARMPARMAPKTCRCGSWPTTFARPRF